MLVVLLLLLYHVAVLSENVLTVVIFYVFSSWCSAAANGNPNKIINQNKIHVFCITSNFSTRIIFLVKRKYNFENPCGPAEATVISKRNLRKQSSSASQVVVNFYRRVTAVNKDGAIQIVWFSFLCSIKGLQLVFNCETLYCLTLSITEWE